MKSRFLELYNLLMEDASKDLLYSKTIDLANDESLPDFNDKDFYKKGIDLLKNIADLSEFEPIVSGGKTIKIVKNGMIDNSIIKASDIQYDELNIDSIKRNSKLNAIFYLLKYRIFKDPNYNLKMTGKDSLDAETLQIKDISKKIDDLDGEVTIKTPDDTILGPFNKIVKIKGTPKADAVLMSDDDNDNKMFLSLKNGGKAGEFRQFGGKRDLSIDDYELIDKSDFIRDTVDLLKSFFNRLHEQHPEKVKENDFDFKYLRNYVDDVNITQLAFDIPDSVLSAEYELLEKAKWGREFPNSSSSENNVDVLIDGNVTFTDLKEDLKDKAEDDDNEINLKTLNADYHQEWNPSIYDVDKDDDKDNDFNIDKDIYRMVLVFIRYNANKEDVKTNRLNFADFKNCRFQIYPRKRQIQRDIERTKQLFIQIGLEQEFNKLYE